MSAAERLPAEELLTVSEVAALLRKTPKAVYTMIEREQLAGVIRVGRLVRFRSDDLRRSLGLIPSAPTNGSRPKG